MNDPNQHLAPAQDAAVNQVEQAEQVLRDFFSHTNPLGLPASTAATRLASAQLGAAIARLATARTRI